MNSEAEDFLDDDLEDGESDDFDDEFAEDVEEVESDDPFGEDLEDEDELKDEPLDDEFAADDLEDDTDETVDAEPEPEDDDFEAALADDDGGPELEETLEEEPTATEPTPAVELGENGEIGEPPYLVRHPSRPDAEIVTLEWVRYLVDTAGLEGAARTIAYYRSVEWLSDGVETYLLSLLHGFSDQDDLETDDLEARSVLTPAEHKRSLQYIAWIATPERKPGLIEEADDGLVDAVTE